MVDKQITKEELLERAKKPAADAMRLHRFYQGKMQTALRCRVRDLHDFAIWYTCLLYTSPSPRD